MLWRDAALALAKSTRAVAGDVKVYRRGSEFAIEIFATVGGTTYQALNNEGQVVEQLTLRDYLISACELQVGSLQIVPKAGDVISEVDCSGETIFWLVCPPSIGEQPYRYSDSSRTLFRVHTKRTKGS
jgi:hypothetical protein